MKTIHRPIRATRLGDLPEPEYRRAFPGELDREDPRGHKAATIEAMMRDKWGEPFNVPGLGLCWQGKAVTQVNGKRRKAVVVVDVQNRAVAGDDGQADSVAAVRGAAGGGVSLADREARM